VFQTMRSQYLNWSSNDLLARCHLSENFLLEGAFGEICVAKWRGTTVAAKTILAPLANNPQIV
jgi:hypothetical protein